MRYPSASIFRLSNFVNCLLACTFLFFFLAGNTIAGTFKVFGPETFQRQTRMPKAEIRSFSVINPNTEYLIKVYNGALEDTEYERVSSTVLEINGIQVVGPQEFNQKIDSIEKPIVLNFSNELIVEVRGKPGGAITVEIIGIDEEPPFIEGSISPSPNEYDWNNGDVTVSFTCNDAISGILNCPDPVTIDSEGKDQMLPAPRPTMQVIARQSVSP